jgi:hypothetical protein
MKKQKSNGNPLEGLMIEGIVRVGPEKKACLVIDPDKLALFFAESMKRAANGEVQGK